GHVLVAGAVVVPVFLVALHRGGIGLGTVARACAWPFLGGAVMTAVVLVLERLLGDGVLALLAIGVAGALTYGLCVLPSLGFLRGAPSGAAPVTVEG
ncbi:lipopolysaccharide biosynthesis protein, partial [Streptomyces sp. NPDC054956]